MKAAAPQAPVSTNATAKTSSKGNAASARPAGGVAFAGVLATAVAAKARIATSEPPRGLVREAAAGKAEPHRAASPRAASPRGKTTGREEPRAAGQRHADPAPAALLDAARVPVAALPPAAALAPAAMLPPAAAAPAQTRTGASAQRGEPRIQVIDLRKKPAAAEAQTGERAGSRSAAERAEGQLAATKPFAERLAASEASRRPAPDAPLERIREMTGSELVRTVGLVVRDGGGEIRLTLKPESLGSVRIRLSIEDGKVEARIVVDTPEARQAFEAGIDSLTRALQADGFKTGSLQVSVSGGNANDSRQAAGLLGDTIRGARLRASDEALQEAVPPVGWAGDGLVNVFA